MDSKENTMNYNERLQRTKQAELFAFLILIIFACCLMLKFQSNCRELRGDEPIVKSPNPQILKAVSDLRAVNQ